MPLQVQQRLGPYEILNPIGAGGMGEVYKARDTRLNRVVAIKVLPAHISANPQAKQRFEREARTVASLNHPHICQLYDVGQQDGIDFLVMEYLEGVTLANRLEKGPLPMSEAVKIALQVAEALDKAHQSGVVHRDLKPTNIMLPPGGAKLVDFGLAKGVGESKEALKWSGPDAPTVGPSASANLTNAGAILGTLQYMAPEQIEGEEADTRTDIFAFGAVLYEMITGRRAFQGKSQVSLMSAILTCVPPMPSRVHSGVPPMLDNIIKGCLAKDPVNRWHSAHDVWLQLQWSGETGSSLEQAATVTKPNRRLRVLTAILTIALVLALIPAALYFRSARSTEPVRGREKRFEVSLAPGLTPTTFTAIAPDGSRVAFIGRPDSGKTAIWMHSFNSSETRLLPGTEGAGGIIFWKPDSQSIGFYVADEGRLKTIDVTGGRVQPLLSLVSFGGGAWSRDGTIVVGTRNGPLRRITESGGEVTDVTELDKSRDEIYHGFPSFLPDGRHLLYFAASAKRENRGIFIGSLDSKARTLLMPAENGIPESTAFRYTPPGFILFSFADDQSLGARPFDADKMAFSGPAVTLVDNVAGFSVSDDGTLVYRTVTVRGATRQLTWVDRMGNTVESVGEATGAFNMRLSPDGKRVALSEEGGVNRDISILELDTKPPRKTRLTTDPASDIGPVFSPDGSEVIFSSDRQAVNVVGLYQKPSNGAVAEHLFLPPEPGKFRLAWDWSRAGLLVVGKEGIRSGLADLFIISVADQKEKPYLETTWDKPQAALSPNGRWLAYVSKESGQYEVVVQPFPNPSTGKRTISAGAGFMPRWKQDGRELYYLDGEQRMVAVSVTTEPDFVVGKSTTLFKTSLPDLSRNRIARPGLPYQYDIRADGQQFLILAPIAPAEQTASRPTITAIINWPAMLKR